MRFPSPKCAAPTGVERHLHSFSPQHLSGILNAYAKLQMDSPRPLLSLFPPNLTRPKILLTRVDQQKTLGPLFEA